MANRREQQTDLMPAEATDRIWELAENIDVCMFVTWDGEYNRARPLSARVVREETPYTSSSMTTAPRASNCRPIQRSHWPGVTTATTNTSRCQARPQ